MRRSLVIVSCVVSFCACADDPAREAAADGRPDATVDAAVPLDANRADAKPEPRVDAAVDASTREDAATPVDPRAEAMGAQADALLATLMLRFWPALRANDHTIDWMFAHYWEALLDAAERRGPTAFAGTARMFFELQQKRGWINDFYDDENWLTLTLLHAHALTGEAAYLAQAKVVFTDIQKAWDESCCGAQKGGLWWKKPMIDKVTAINAGAVISAARLYDFTREQAYLDFAKKAYDFWAQNMVDASGHVYDGFNSEGVINKGWRFTYNEGLFIGAIVELSRVTQDDSRLPLAHKVAAFMLKEQSKQTPLGTVMSDGKCSGDGEMFKGIGARYLAALYEVDRSHTEYRDFLERSAQAAWMYARDAQTGLVTCDWAGPFDAANARVGSLGSAAVGAAAAARALGVGQKRPALQFEAEEGNLQGVGLEAQYAGFSGWAYLAGWGATGQLVSFDVDVDRPGLYDVELRYASGEASTRTLTIVGNSKTVDFPSTGGYANYGAVHAEVSLAAGRNVLVVARNAGDTGFINLDRLQLTPK